MSNLDYEESKTKKIRINRGFQQGDNRYAKLFTLALNNAGTEKDVELTFAS